MTATHHRDLLLERDRELATLDALVESAARCTGSMSIIEGPAGIGKSSLVDAVSSQAAKKGVQLLRARGSSLEQDFTFGVVHQLLAPVVHAASSEDRERWFADGAAPCRDLLLGTSTTLGTESGQLFPILQGLYWFLVSLVDDAPVVIVVDDLQWVDESSSRFLAFVAARLADLPVGLVVATRNDSERPDALLAELARQRETTVLTLAPLGRESISGLVEDVLAQPVAPSFTDACLRVTGGVPFYVRSLLDELVEVRIVPSAENADRVERVRPDALGRSLLSRIARAPGPSVAIARAIAILQRAPSVQTAAALAGVDVDVGRTSIDHLIASGILDHEGLSFAHPVIESAVLEDIPGPAEADLHRRAAHLLADQLAPDERISAHLLRSEPDADPWVVDVLTRTAERAMRSGGAADAYQLLRRALAEPPAPAVEPSVRYALGEAELRSGPPRAAKHLRIAYERGSEEPWWPSCARDLGRALMFSGRGVEGASVLFEAATSLERAGQADAALSLWIDWFFVANLTAEVVDEARAQIDQLIRRVGDASSPRARLLLGAIARTGAHTDVPADVVAEQARRAFGNGDLFAIEPPDSQNHFAPIYALILAGDLDAGDRAIDSLRAASMRLGSGAGAAMAHMLGALSCLRRGDLAEAESDGVRAVEMTSDHSPFAVPMSLGLALEAKVERGDVEGATALLDTHAHATDFLPPGLGDHLLMGRARLRLAQGRTAEALEDCRSSGLRMAEWRSPGPAVVPWRSRGALAALAEGLEDDARALADEELSLARSYGCAHTLARALQAQARVRREEAEDALTEAMDVLDGGPFALERARVHTELGTLLRRSGRTRRAREHLRAGLSEATTIGARPIAARARHELVASGARPRRPVTTGVDALTASEHRTCRLAADGRTNRQIAQELFVTVKTVEVHLTNSYRKLGISSRQELPRVLGGSATGGSPAGTG